MPVLMAHTTGAPDCAARNREDCSTVTRTCGECLAQYLGAAGAANTQCIRMTNAARSTVTDTDRVTTDRSASASLPVALISSSLKQPHSHLPHRPHYAESNETNAINNHDLTGLAQSRGRGRDGDACTSSSECLSGECKSRRCTWANKLCPDKCSGNGQCVYLDVFDNSRVSSCRIQDSSCRAVCICRDGTYGRTCSMFRTEFTSLQASRTSLCAALQFASATQNADDEFIVRQRSSSVSGLLSEPTQITMVALQNCSAVIFDTINKYPSIAAAAGSD